MNKDTYKDLEKYMLECMTDSAHDKEHIYRVLYIALDIAREQETVDMDVLISAALLHDIGRQEEYEDYKCCHAVVGGQKAYDFLIQQGWEQGKAEHVKACIKSHRYRTNRRPETIEAKIIFDADKVDVTGTLGIARALFYKGQIGHPLYSVKEDGTVSNGSADSSPSFFQEYKFKLENIYDKFHTARAYEIARNRKAAAEAFYNAILEEASASYLHGREILESLL